MALAGELVTREVAGYGICHCAGLWNVAMRGPLATFHDRLILLH